MIMTMQTRYGEVALDFYEENGVNIVTHTSLSLLLNSLRAEGKVEDIFVPLKEQIIDTANGVYLAEVRLKDTNTGVIYRGIGEVNPMNIESDIAKRNPIIMAFNRAEDKAFLALLGTEKRVYSSIEMNKDDSNSQNQADSQSKLTPPPVTTPATAPTTVKNNVTYDISNSSVKPVTETTAVPEQKNVTTEMPNQDVSEKNSPFSENEPVINPVQTSIPVSNAGPLEEFNATNLANDEQEVETKESQPVDVGDTIIPNGRLAGKKLKEADQKWLDWFGDFTKDGVLPPKYTKDFVDAYNAFISLKNN